MARKLTEPQARLLAEIRESSTGGLWIRYYSRWSRTARVLADRGLIRATESGMNHTWWEPVPAESGGSGSGGVS